MNPCNKVQCWGSLFTLLTGFFLCAEVYADSSKDMASTQENLPVNVRKISFKAEDITPQETKSAFFDARSKTRSGDYAVEVPIEKGDISITLQLEYSLNDDAIKDGKPDPALFDDDHVFKDSIIFTAVTSPSGDTYYKIKAPTQEHEPGSPEALIAEEGFFPADSPLSKLSVSNSDEGTDNHLATFFIPSIEGNQFQQGNYRVEFSYPDKVASLVRADAYIKYNHSEKDVDQIEHTMNINIWSVLRNIDDGKAVAIPDATIEELQRLLENDHKDTINKFLSRSSIQVDQINFIPGKEEEIQQFFIINKYSNMTKACEAFNEVTKNKNAMNIILTNYIAELKPGQDTEDESEYLTAGYAAHHGNAAGILSHSNCTFIALADASEHKDPDLANTIIHELGHQLSLFHTTESSGVSIETLDDTPVCDAETFDGRDNASFDVKGEKDGVLTPEECSFEGGADNIMFYTSSEHFQDYHLSEQQAQIIRRHPLIFPRTVDYEYKFPNNLKEYQAGTRVLQPKSGKVYECKSYPNSGFCGQWSTGSNEFEPGVGTAWPRAWTLIEK